MFHHFFVLDAKQIRQNLGKTTYMSLFYVKHIIRVVIVVTLGDRLSVTLRNPNDGVGLVDDRQRRLESTPYFCWGHSILWRSDTSSRWWPSSLDDEQSLRVLSGWRPSCPGHHPDYFNIFLFFFSFNEVMELMAIWFMEVDNSSGTRWDIEALASKHWHAGNESTFSKKEWHNTWSEKQRLNMLRDTKPTP